MSSINKELIQQFIVTSSKIRKLMEQGSSMSSEERVATALQFQAMHYLMQHPKTTVGDLANELMMSSGAIAQLTERLVNKGWIKREDTENDRRIILLSLTKEGEENIMEMKKKFFKKIESFLSNIPEKDLEDLVRIQTKMLKNLENKNLC